MFVRLAIITLALGASACQRQPAGESEPASIEAPTEQSEPARVFAPANEAARTALGDLTLTMSLHLPDQAGGDAQEMLTMRAVRGLVVEAQLSTAVSPATQVQGQTLRARLALPVEASQTLAYRVIEETHPEGLGGLCGAAEAASVLVWEPSAPGETALKIMGFTGGLPGAADARACQLLEFTRR